MPQFEFHVSRKARQKYQFDESLFALNGNVVLADFAAARRFAERITLVRGYPVPASHINAMGLIDEIQHLLVREYERRNPGVLLRALQGIQDPADTTLLRFTEEFPPLQVYRGEVEPQAYLERESAGRPNRLATLEELFILHMTNQNPAVQPYKELFDEEPLKQTSPYEQTVRTLRTFFQNQLPFSINTETGKGESLVDVLLAPFLRSPTSLMGQLEYLLERWRDMLGEAFVTRILRSIDYVNEERIRNTSPGGFGSTPVLTFTGRDYTEYERFSQDKDWMPRLVLIAGRYEGFDERIRTGLGAEPLSVGDYVLNGGELPAMVVVDAVVRLLPGALGAEDGAADESFADGLLEYPQYTRPREFAGMCVPEVLLSGDHKKIAAWRDEQRLQRTKQRRADMFGDH